MAARSEKNSIRQRERERESKTRKWSDGLAKDVFLKTRRRRKWSNYILVRLATSFLNCVRLKSSIMV